jgi:type I restriction enzyme S subunit
MTANDFLEQFGTLADAPGGISKLRDLILQLAIQGKLAPQDATEESAAQLLERMKGQQDRLIWEKIIRAPKVPDSIASDEMPFPLPSGWQWVRLGNIGDWGSGATPTRGNPEYFGGSIQWFKSGELNEGFISQSAEMITDKALQDFSLRLDKPGDVLIAMYGATIGKVAILEVEATTNQAVCACTCFDGFYNRFLFLLLKAYKTVFIGGSAGAAQPNFSKDKIIITVAPLPPLEEQKRIVAKVDRLMALCDALEAQQQARHAVRSRLHATLLGNLQTAANAADFARAWQRLRDHFAELFTPGEAALDAVAQLRQTILQLAVQGKLVPQDAGDNPSNLNEIPLAKLLREDSLNGYSKQPSAVPAGVEILRISAGTSRKDGIVNEDDFKWAVLNEGETQKFSLEKGDLLACRFNGNLHYVGKFSLYTGYTDRQQVFPDKLIRFRVDENLCDARYVCLAMNSSMIRERIEEFCATTAGNIGISATNLKTVSLPVPPLSEQQRIVAKVQQLMTQCAALEASLKEAATVSERWSVAAVRQLLGAFNE